MTFPSAGLSPIETARYTLEMVRSLQKLAVQQDQTLLAHLLGLAAVEAKVQSDDHETALPG